MMHADGTTAAWDKVLGMLWARSRFASYFYQFTDFVPHPDLPTLALAVTRSRFQLYYRPGFVEQTQPEHLLGLLVHEMLHVVLDHAHRSRSGKSKNPHLRNLAQDMVINSFLVEHEKTFFSRKGVQETPVVRLPPGLPVIPAAFSKNPGKGRLGDASWEEVYDWLAARVRENAESGGEAGTGPGAAWGLAPWKGGRPGGKAGAAEGLCFTDNAGEPLPTGLHLLGDADENSRAEAGKKRILRFIQQSGDCEGERLYGELAGLLEKPALANTSWKARIRNLVDRASMSTQWRTSWSRPNRRYFDAGIYAPGRSHRHNPLVTVAVDVSGSMAAQPALLEQAFGVVEDLARDFRVSLVCMDQDLFVPRKAGGFFATAPDEKPYFYQRGDWRFLRSGSRGATFFAPLFNRYLLGHTEALLVITDGYVYDLDALRPYPRTVWAVPPGQKSFRPPFGTVVTMEAES
ncbi:MAG: hypothetical protein KKA60_01675 [Proteobacteria bacterium]|nr:hypothetical protein [Pseudomonadota bacterium]